MYYPKISIIIPIYNVESYIGYTLEDMLGQTYTNIEIIAVDDGSTDRSVEIADEYAKKDARIRVIHTENRGLSAARNTGLKESSAAYVFFMDSDDRAHPDLLKSLYEVMISTNADIVQSGVFSFIDDNIIPLNERNNQYDIYTKREMCRFLANGEIVGTTIAHNKLYKRELFDGEIEFPEGRIHEDVATVYRLFWKSEKIVVLRGQFFYYRSKRAGSITHAPFSVARLDGLTAARERFVFFKNNNEEELYGAFLANWCDVASYSIGELIKSNIVGRNQYIEQIRKEFKERYFELINITQVHYKTKLRIGINFWMAEIKILLNQLGVND